MANEVKVENIKGFSEAYSALQAKMDKGIPLDKLEADINGFAKSLKMPQEAIDLLKSKLADYGKHLLGLGTYINSATGAQERFNKIMNMAEEKVGQLGNKLQDLKAKTGNATLSNEAFAAKAADLSPAMMHFTKVPAYFDKIGEAAKNNQSQLTEFINKNPAAMSMLSAALKKATGDIVGDEDVKKYAAYIDANQNLRRGMVMLAATTGNLSEMIGNVGSNLSGLDDRAESFTTMVTTIADATNMSTEEVAEFSKQLMSMPGALDNMNKTTAIAGEQMHLLTAALRFAAGSGQDSKVVVGELSKMYDNFGTSGEEALKTMNRLKEASNATHLPISTMSEAVFGMSESMSMLGNNTDGIINIFAKLAPALQRVGVAPAKIFEMTKQITAGIQEMGTAQKAFLSSSTGGPGGLQGAFQVDLLLRQGKTDEVFDKIQKNLRQRMGGGSIVTLEQAGQSSQAAAQYQKQLSFMTSKSMGGMAKDEASASRMLEAMAKGDMKEFSSSISGNNSEDRNAGLKKTLDIGNKLQQDGNSSLQSMSKNVEAMAGRQAIGLGGLTRNLIGSESENGKEYSDKANRNAQALMNQNPITGKGTAGGVGYNQLYEKKGEKLKDIANTFKKNGPVQGAKAIAKYVGEDIGFVDDNKSIDDSRKLVEEQNQAGNPSGYGLAAPGEVVRRNIARGEKATAQSKTETPVGVKGKSAETGSNVHVKVQTVCSTCMKEVAKDTIKQHQHDIDRGAITGQK